MSGGHASTFFGGFFDFDGVDMYGVFRIETFHRNLVGFVTTGDYRYRIYLIVDEYSGVDTRFLQVQVLVIGPHAEITRVGNERGFRIELLDNLGNPDFLVKALRQAAGKLQRNQRKPHLDAEHQVVVDADTLGKQA